MKNTARTTVREGRQSSDNTYVRTVAAEQNCLQALSEHRQWWSGGHISRQTVPDVGTVWLVFGARLNCVNPCITRVISERFRGWVVATKSYTNPRLLCFTYPTYIIQYCGLQTKHANRFSLTIQTEILRWLSESESSQLIRQGYHI